MKLKVIQIDGKGNLEKEVVWLEATEVCALKYHVLCDTTYTDESHISDELRHTYWFPTKEIAKGDMVCLHTKNGTPSEVKNNRDTVTHHLYWNIGRTLWNKAGDCAVLFEVNTWKATKV